MRTSRRGGASETRVPRVYPDLDAAAQRVGEMNPRLEPAMAQHIAAYAVRAQDAGLAWKFDNWSRPGVRRDEFTLAEMRTFIAAITCPVLFVVGAESGAKRGMEELAGEFPGRPFPDRRGNGPLGAPWRPRADYRSGAGAFCRLVAPLRRRAAAPYARGHGEWGERIGAAADQWRSAARGARGSRPSGIPVAYPSTPRS